MLGQVLPKNKTNKKKVHGLLGVILGCPAPLGELRVSPPVKSGYSPNMVRRDHSPCVQARTRNRRGREESLLHVTMAKPGQNLTSCSQASQEKTHFQKTLIKQGPK